MTHGGEFYTEYTTEQKPNPTIIELNLEIFKQPVETNPESLALQVHNVFQKTHELYTKMAREYVQKPVITVLSEAHQLARIGSDFFELILHRASISQNGNEQKNNPNQSVRLKLYQRILRALYMTFVPTTPTEEKTTTPKEQTATLIMNAIQDIHYNDAETWYFLELLRIIRYTEMEQRFTYAKLGLYLTLRYQAQIRDYLKQQQEYIPNTQDDAQTQLSGFLSTPPIFSEDYDPQASRSLKDEINEDLKTLQQFKTKVLEHYKDKEHALDDTTLLLESIELLFALFRQQELRMWAEDQINTAFNQLHTIRRQIIPPYDENEDTYYQQAHTLRKQWEQLLEQITWPTFMSETQTPRRQLYLIHMFRQEEGTYTTNPFNKETIAELLAIYDQLPKPEVISDLARLQKYN